MKNILKISLFILIAFGFSLSSFTSRNGGVDEDIFKFTNQFRKSNGLNALTGNTFLNELAENHSRNMASKKLSFGHGDFEKRNIEAKRKIKDLSAFGENVAYGNFTGSEVVEQWKNSNGHRKNMLGNFTMIGIGVATAADGTLFYTQIFAK